MRMTPCLFGVLLLTIVPGGAVSAQTFRPAPPPAGAPWIGFGSDAAVAGGDVLVGRPGILSGFPVPAMERGAVHVFRRNASGAWAEAAMITAEGTTVKDGFGARLAVAGTWLAVGAPLADDGAGAVYLFERNAAGTWVQRARLSPPAGAEGGQFGMGLALGEGLLLVGAPGQAEARGLVVAYARSGSGWTERARLTGTTVEEGDRFGSAVALAGDLAVIGAPGPGGNPQQMRPGTAFVFRRGGGGAWTEEARLAPDSTARGFGTAVGAGGMGVFVAHPFSSEGGAVVRFAREGNRWVRKTRIVPEESVARAQYGASLALDGHDLLVGAPTAGGGAGAVYVLRHDPATDAFSQVQKFTTRNVGIGTHLGAGLGAAGGVAAAGAPMGAFLEGVGFIYTRSADGTWREAAGVAGDAPTALSAVTGGEVDCANGEARAFDCGSVDLVAFLPSSALGAKRGIWVNDMWGWSDEATGREFAIVGRSDATTFVEITDPANPVYLGELPLHEGAQPNLWRDIKVYADHAFIVADGAGPHGMQVFDLTRLRSVMNPPVTFTEDAHYDRIHSAHNIVIDTTSGFAYTVGNSMGGETCGGALHMIDIRDPTHPTFAGCYGDPATGFARTGYTHDAQCVVYNGPDEAYRGRQICFNASETALGIADVTDKANPKPISSATYPNVAYAHQGWLSDDHRYFYLNDEGDELSGAAPRTRTLIFDVQDLDDPVMVHAYLGETPATDHNLYVKGRYVYESNYVAGLRIIDIGDPTNPVEVGYFDTVPFGDNSAGFAGSWSNYPFFKSGVIGVTSIREGFFLLRFNPPTPVP